MVRDDRVAVISAAQTDLRKSWSGAQHVDLISTVVSKALKGSGITLDQVDFVIDSGSDVLDGRSISNCGFLGAMGAHHKEESRVEEDGLWAALYGAVKIASGAADVGLIIAYSKPSESDLSLFYSSQCEPFYQRPVGFDQAAACGMQAQQYAQAQGDEAMRHFAAVTAQAWKNAAKNSRVESAEALSIDDILAAPFAARPLTKAMMSRPLDGAVAILLANADVARRKGSKPVWITGMGTAMDSHAFSARKPGKLEACEVAAKSAYERAGIKDASRISIAEISAPSAAGELMVVDALGVAKERAIDCYRGQAGVAVNPSGGALPADPVMATGLIRLAEASNQLAGETDRAAAANAVVHGCGGVGMQNHCVFVLEA
jgi:acetyl-CoA C-acetyltransferase